MFKESIVNKIKRGKFLPIPHEYPKNMYDINSESYRTIEFNDIDWADSVVIFGCSNVFGNIDDDNNTLSTQLQEMINTPVINMGVCASSMEFSFFNNMILKNNYPIPKAVVNVWTSIDRTTSYLRDKVINHGSWSPNEIYMKAYNETHSNPEVHAIMMQLITKQSWIEKTQYYECTFFSSTAKLLNIYQQECVDRASDNMHPGQKTTYNLAIKIKKELCL